MTRPGMAGATRPRPRRHDRLCRRVPIRRRALGRARARYPLRLLVGTAAAFHLAGTFAADRARALATTLHACGTAALGGGIFLAGQIFHLSEHWPSGVLLWSLGAWAGWALLRDWPHAFFAAVLTPAWLVGEWMVAATSRAGGAVLATEVLVTALAYLSAVPDPRGISSAPRTTLAWIGGIALVPAALALVAAHGDSYLPGDLDRVLSVAGWIGAIGLPVALAWWLRSGLSLPLLSLAAWTVAGPFFEGRRGAYPFLWAGVLSLGLVTWGLLERRSERINLGVAGFGITVLSFYFSSVMDRLGRSASLVGLGLLFLGGGWAMEQGRRRLVARVAGGSR